MKIAINSTLFVCLCLAGSLSAMAAEVVISDDGRQIQLNGDGTWVQLSKDRYANNAAGQRVRLKPDGTWSLLGDVTASVAQTNAPLTSMTAALESTLFLAKVEILRHRIKRAKSVHAATRSIYHLQVVNDSQTDVELDDTLASKLTARSSSGAQFAIEEVTFSTSRIKPGERGVIQIVADGSPKWFGVKAMMLEVAPGALGNRQARVLSKSMNDVEKREVDDL
jgi:hypothetical protein